MPKFDDYTQKSTPEDTDLMLLLDKTENANKKVLFSGIWNWIVKKLAEAVIEKLQTSDKTIIGALNELNSKSLSVSGDDKWIHGIDLNTFSGNGIFFMSTEIENSPIISKSVWAPMLQVERDNRDTIRQVIFEKTGMYLRSYQSNSWSEWIEI